MRQLRILDVIHTCVFKIHKGPLKGWIRTSTQPEEFLMRDQFRRWQRPQLEMNLDLLQLRLEVDLHEFSGVFYF